MYNINLPYIILLKYDPQIWGSFSDWLNILITCFTVIFLLMTLRSQVAIQKIELTRLKREILPSFRIEMSIELDGVSRISLIPNGKSFYRLHYQINIIEGRVEDLNNPIRNTGLITHSFKDVIIYRFKALYDENSTKSIFDFTIHYEDDYGTNYKISSLIDNERITKVIGPIEIPRKKSNFLKLIRNSIK